VVAAMIKLHANQQLKDMGWKMVLQVHDEVIMVMENLTLYNLT